MEIYLSWLNNNWVTSQKSRVESAVHCTKNVLRMHNDIIIQIIDPNNYQIAPLKVQADVHFGLIKPTSITRQRTFHKGSRFLKSIPI